eukprot:SAG31_NODE_1573_length_7850_cov_1.757193_4_plen_52_part_00
MRAYRTRIRRILAKFSRHAATDSRARPYLAARGPARVQARAGFARQRDTYE